jgi:AcrR family transcriptional regulator
MNTPPSMSEPARSSGGRGRKSELVRTVYAVMARDGVHRVPLQQIAEEAGVSKGLLLYHFATKDAMVLAAMDWVLEATGARIRERMRGVTRPQDLLPAVLDAIWIDPEANRDFFRFYLDGVEHQARSPEFDEFGERGRSIIETLYGDVIGEGVDAGIFCVDDVGMAATQMRGVIEGLFLGWLQTTDWRATHPHFKSLCLQSLQRVLGVDRVCP